MDNVLEHRLVDYSLLATVFYVHDERMVLDHVSLPNCVERRLRDFRVGNGERLDRLYGDAPGSILVCFSIIDILMEFTFAKTPENAILFGKWSDWGPNFINMFHCL